jgi:hypothetical protein
LCAADRKIVINATDPHNGWAFTDEALREYRNAGKDAAIVLARSPADMDREVADADAIIGGISKDLYAKAKTKVGPDLQHWGRGLSLERVPGRQRRTH